MRSRRSSQPRAEGNKMASLPRSVFCAAAAVVLTVSYASRASGPQQPFTIAISTAQNVFKSGSEIALQLVLTNTSRDSIQIGQAIDGTSPIVAGRLVEVYVHDEKSDPAPETKYQRALRGEGPPSDLPVTSGIGSSLSPGKNSGKGLVIILNKFYDLREPGKYKIELQWADPTSKTIVKSNTTTVTVTP